jgi:CheY-like chemotaxis protein
MSSHANESTPPTILLVEDDPDHAELIKLSFQDHQVANQLLHFTTGEAALDYRCAGATTPTARRTISPAWSCSTSARLAPT